MAYLKPNAFVKSVFNKLAMMFGIGGAVTLIVKGRKSGTPQSIPVIPVEQGGARYIVSTRGESEWVRNLRATGSCELQVGGKSTTYSATEIPAPERPPIIEAYRKVAGEKVVGGYFATLPDPADHPTFRLS
ncbi:MAG TPA: nitroreductase/quinone reductase family protein [Candidatus Xenobia bacterium]|jgi:deazaflavin-dependent oxidoreductase (nitroreductase family)